MAPPNIAGILASFKASFGITLAKEIARIAGKLWSEEAPNGHCRFLLCRTLCEA